MLMIKLSDILRLIARNLKASRIVSFMGQNMVIATHIMVPKMVVVFNHIKTHTNFKLYFLKNTILGRRISKSLSPSIYFFKIYEKGVEMGQNDTFWGLNRTQSYHKIFNRLPRR